jgi:hypothetical protein
MQMIFSKAMFDLEVGWIHFHKTKQQIQRGWLVMGIVCHIKKLVIIIFLFFFKFGYE